MSLKGSSNETERVTTNQGIAAGGASEDEIQIQATEDREIVGVAYDDQSQADCGGEVSFSSQRTINTEQTDNTKASPIFSSYSGGEVMGLSIDWDAGEELHFHYVNNSGATVQTVFTIYYREV